eukprot:jgi/Galph1/2305/GphlegSOOS_G967.1
MNPLVEEPPPLHIKGNKDLIPGDRASPTCSEERTTSLDSDIRLEEYEKRLRRFCCFCCFQCGLAFCYSYEKEETRDAINSFCHLIIENGFQDLLPNDWILGLKLYKRIYRQKEESAPSLEQQSAPLQVVQEAQYFMQHAEAVFGPLLFAVEKPAQAVVGITPQLVIFLRTGVHSKDLISSKFKATTYFPAYYMCYDHFASTIVVAVRGTLSIADALTDLDGRTLPLVIHWNEEPQEGFVHGGILRASENLADIIELHLKEACQKYPSYRIVVTGHSLGAGCAIVLSILLRERMVNECLQCYAFGPPPVLSDNLAEVCRSFIFSFVNHNDIVPRLSIPALRRFFRACQMAKQLNTFRRWALWFGFDDWIEMDAQCLEDDSDALYETRRLHVAGTIYHMIQTVVENGSQQSSTKNGLRLKRSIYKPTMLSISRYSLREIIGTKGMLFDHLPENYSKCLSEILKRNHVPKLKYIYRSNISNRYKKSKDR